METQLGRGSGTLKSYDAMQYCIKVCLDCFQVCTETIKTCNALGGQHAEHEHLALLQSCAHTCATTAEILLLGSKAHIYSCEACAEICEMCAEECSGLQGLEECENACITCAGSCRQMSNR